MEIIPAIDLLEGQCVRLVQGRYDRVIHYRRDPVEVAREFCQAGAKWLHVIDLDGVRVGRPVNLDGLLRIVQATGAQVEFGGGIRDEAAIDASLAAGARRVIVGTRALEDFEWFRRVAHRPEYARRICLGLDARLGKLTIQGRTQDTQRTAVEVAESVADWPLAAIVYTDVGRDGMLLGPNVQAIRSLVSVSALPVVAAGGVTDLDDVKTLAGLNLAGLVIGRAIYEGMIALSDAIRVAAGTAPAG